MSEPGLLGRPGSARQQSRPSTRASAKRLETLRAARSASTRTPRELLELDAGDGRRDRAPRSRRCARELERLQEAALFNGEYDAGDAVVTLQSGTGGTDAQDWTEMLLRMYLRWAADRGFKIELLEASPGEEAGLKSRDVHGRAARTPTGSSRPSAASTASSACRRSTSAHRRHTSFATVIVAPLLPDDADVEIDEGDLQDRHLPRAGRRRPAREQDRLRRADHAPADAGSSSSARTSARSRRTSRRRCACSRSRLVELAEEEREAELAKERGAAQDTGFGEPRSAAMCSTRTSSSRTTAPATRRETPRASSTATSTRSSTRTCSRRRPGQVV